MKNNRPDQARFELFIAHFADIDQELQLFCDTQGYKLERNINRQPGRLLRKTGNPEYIIEIFLAKHWLDVEFNEDLPHSMGVCAYYVPPEDKLSIWKVSSVLVEDVTFGHLGSGLASYLATALRTASGWTPEVIMREGQRGNNLRAEYA